ncbi:Uncharacterised protein [Bordetella ansorpii]|uniref:Uncharacterized protein n=1 Tax=Bordetella ansorpii TaxID=288768 RepID=A0A157S544_9BORD|nr:Uncharacterised protein [Bordetella ansorpii]
MAQEWLAEVRRPQCQRADDGQRSLKDDKRQSCVPATAVGLADCAPCFGPNHRHAALIPDAFGLDR